MQLFAPVLLDTIYDWEELLAEGWSREWVFPWLVFAAILLFASAARLVTRLPPAHARSAATAKLAARVLDLDSQIRALDLKADFVQRSMLQRQQLKVDKELAAAKTADAAAHTSAVAAHGRRWQVAQLKLPFRLVLICVFFRTPMFDLPVEFLWPLSVFPLNAGGWAPGCV